MQQIEIHKTDDGSATLYLPDMDEHYHSTKGAMTESDHVFIKMGLDNAQSGDLSVLEVGFGTGLNALLSAIWARENSRHLSYFGYELYPLPAETVVQLGYPTIVEDVSAADYLRTMLSAPWDEAFAVNENMQLTKIHADILVADFPQSFDVVYFDAFAPSKQEEMWNQPFFDKISASMNPGAVFTTYCAKGSVKRMLQAAGLQIKKVPGPPGGKREMLTAYKPM